MSRVPTARRSIAAGIVMAAGILGGAASGLLGVCGPFTDVAADSFCAFVFEVFTLGITTGTTPATYEPTSAVSRLQMAAFLSRSVDGVLKRGSRRAALRQTWTNQGTASLGLTTVGLGPRAVESDGLDLWVANFNSATVSRVRGSDGRLLETWTGATTAAGVLSAMGKVFVPSFQNPGKLYRIDPSQPGGVVTTVASNLGDSPSAIAFDGARIWTANLGSAGSVSIVTPTAAVPWTVTTVAAGFDALGAVLYDGANIWVTDRDAGTLLKLNENGGVLQTVTLGPRPSGAVFDGSNIWVPDVDFPSISVVRASNGAVLATLTGNGLVGPRAAAFDGQRVLVTDIGGNSVSLWKAADLTPIGTFSTGANTNPVSACSDGVNFWITLNTSNQLARF